jgi:hypothetical protein
LDKVLAVLPAVTDIAVEPHGIRNLNPRPGEPSFLEDKFGPAPQFITFHRVLKQ